MKKIILFTLFMVLLNACLEDTTSNETQAIDQEQNNAHSISENISENLIDKQEEKNNTSTASPKKEDRLPMREEMQNKLERMHEHLMGQMETGIDAKEVKKYMKESEAYMNLYGDSLAAEHIFSGAELALAVQDHTGALDYWRIVYQAYRKENHPKVPHAIFMVGYTYENVLDKKDLAKTMYKKLLKDHPDHELAKEVKKIMANIDRSPEDLIKEFQQKRQN